MKRVVLFVLCATMILTGLVGCSGGKGSDESESNQNSASQLSTESGKQINLSFWQVSGKKEWTEQVVKLFAEKYPNIKVNVTINSDDDQKKNLKVAASSKTMPSMWFNWGGSLASFYPENGISYDLTKYAQEHNWQDKFTDSALKLATLGGQLSGYPTSITVFSAIYRKDIFQKYDIKVPTTFEEFEQAMAKLKQNGITPMALGGKSHVMRMMEILLEMNAGAAEHDKLNALNGDWTQAGVVKAFEKFKEYSDKGYFPDGFVTQQANDARMLMYAGKAAMTIDGPSLIQQMAQDKQDVSLYGYFKIPTNDKGARMSSFIDMIQFSSKLSNEELDAAIKFAEFYISDEVSDKLGGLVKHPRAYKDAKIPSTLPLVPDMLADMSKYGTFNISDQALPQDVVNKLFQAQDSVATGNMTPQKAAEFMKQEIDTYKSTK